MSWFSHIAREPTEKFLDAIDPSKKGSAELPCHQLALMTSEFMSTGSGM
jgi:hypothetical protein